MLPIQHQLRRWAQIRTASQQAAPAVRGGFIRSALLLHHQLLELEFVLVLAQLGAVRVYLLDVVVVKVGGFGRDAAFLADKYLGTTLLVAVPMLFPMDFREMGLK